MRPAGWRGQRHESVPQGFRNSRVGVPKRNPESFAHGRVLVLLDACRSAGLIDGAPGANLLSSAVAAGNVTVLTSSRADKLSREDEAWQHGAFTKVLLDALSDDDVDTGRNGVISMSDLTAYMEKRLDLLTGGDQQLGVEQRFQGEIFVVGL